jgi:hypothetical protein
MIVQMLKEFGRRLQGKLSGKKAFGRLCELLSAVPPGSPVYLDFTGVELVTGSWINACFVPLLNWAADERNDLFPVICKAEKTWVEELALVAEWTHRCFLLAEGAIPPRRAVLVGPLDPGQRATLEALLKLEEATGAKLEREKPEEEVKATAWNNRLRDLFEKRLLRRERRGREQVYSPVVKEITVRG